MNGFLFWCLSLKVSAYLVSQTKFLLSHHFLESSSFLKQASCHIFINKLRLCPFVCFSISLVIFESTSLTVASWLSLRRSNSSSRLSNLLDIRLRPYTKHVTSYLRDTTDFLNNLPTTVPTNTILASFDIEPLYSNITHDLGIEAVNYWTDKYPDVIQDFQRISYLTE